MMKDDDFNLLRGLADERTDKRMNEQTFVIVELLLRLKILKGAQKMKITVFFKKAHLIF